MLGNSAPAVLPRFVSFVQAVREGSSTAGLGEKRRRCAIIFVPIDSGGKHGKTNLR